MPGLSRKQTRGGGWCAGWRGTGGRVVQERGRLGDGSWVRFAAAALALAFVFYSLVTAPG